MIALIQHPNLDLLVRGLALVKPAITPPINAVVDALSRSKICVAGLPPLPLLSVIGKTISAQEVKR